MANSVLHAALPFVVRGARFTILVPYLDADGDPTDPTTPDTEVSKDGAAFADCAEEVTTITGGNGMGYVTLTGAETDCSLLAVAAKVASGPKATLLAVAPRVLPVLESGTAQAGTATSITLAASAADYDLTGAIVKTTGGTGGGGTGGADNQARLVVDYDGTTKVATVSPAWEVTPDNTTTYEVLFAGTDPRVASLGVGQASILTGITDNGTLITNFRTDLGGGVIAVTVGTNGDKTGYGLAAGAIADATFAADAARYQAKVGWIDDNTGNADRYAVIFFKNGQPVTSGITSPDIWVFKNDGTDLVGSALSPQALTQIGTSGTYTHNEATSRQAAGSLYVARVRATIDGSTRTWFQWMGRDSA